MQESQKKNVLVIFKFGTPEKVLTARGTIEKMIQQSRKEAGSLRYDWFSDARDPTTFILFEDYINEDAWNTHLNSDYIQSGLTELKKLTEPQVIFLKPEYVVKK